MIHTLFLVLHATTLIAFLGVFSPSSCVLALPLRTSSMAWIDSKTPPLRTTLLRTSRRTTKIKLKQNPTRALSRSAMSRVVISRTVATGNLTMTREDTGLYPQLSKYYQAAAKSSRKIHELATQSAANHESDPLFQQQSTAQLTSFNNDLLGLQGILQQLGADKGLANYDPTNKLEVLLKEIVNILKDILKDIAGLPVLGPILGPIVFNIKCVTDLALDITENLTDGVLNPFDPLLRPLIGGVE